MSSGKPWKRWEDACCQIHWYHPWYEKRRLSWVASFLSCSAPEFLICGLELGWGWDEYGVPILWDLEWTFNKPSCQTIGTMKALIFPSLLPKSTQTNTSSNPKSKGMLWQISQLALAVWLWFWHMSMKKVPRKKIRPPFKILCTYSPTNMY